MTSQANTHQLVQDRRGRLQQELPELPGNWYWRVDNSLAAPYLTVLKIMESRPVTSSANGDRQVLIARVPCSEGQDPVNEILRTATYMVTHIPIADQFEQLYGDYKKS